ncbi:MAG: class I SAM-dependent methyltransferase [Limisphaerales bacterium]
MSDVPSAADLIREEIRRHGPLTFARFMELALYAPGAGYYERPESTPGRGGDFFTSVSVGPLFGKLLAWQFVRWLPREGPVQLVECGAHDGRLAADVLDALAAHEPAAAARLRYWIVEPSPARRAWQERMLGAHRAAVCWYDRIEDVPAGAVRGVIFSNELLDAFPVHRLRWDADVRGWREWLVDWAETRFVWRPGPTAGVADGLLPDEELAACLPDGFTREWCPAAERWWRTAAMALDEGRLATFDYGAEEEELLLPGHEAGTVRAYLRHRRLDDPLSRPGRCDLTAHVNFTRLRAAGEQAGLDTEEYTSQGRFLTGALARLLRGGGTLAEALMRQARGLQTLTHPGQMGASFRVLVQRRGME